MPAKKLAAQVLPEQLSKLLTSGEVGFSGGLVLASGSTYYLWPEIMERKLSQPEMGLLVLAYTAVLTPAVKGIRKAVSMMKEKDNA